MTWMITYTGRKFYPCSPDVNDICILDIAHALSNTCRFNGHCSSFYSVAQHSVLVSENVGIKNALWGLLHDAAEAYLGDMIRPVKKMDGLQVFGKIEDTLLIKIAEKYNLPPVIPAEVHSVDDVILRTEMRDLRLYNPDLEINKITPLTGRITPWTPKEAETNFLCRFDMLYYDGLGAT